MIYTVLFIGIIIVVYNFVDLLTTQFLTDMLIMLWFYIYTGETVYTPEVSNDGKAVVFLDCNNECSRETDAVVVWNIHLLSENYDVTLSCRDGNCVSKNKEAELLKLEQEFTVINTTLGFQYYPIYQDALVGCVRTTNSCTENHYWLINGAGTIVNGYFVVGLYVAFNT